MPIHRTLQLFFLLLGLAIVSVASIPSTAHAELTGNVELGYVSYKSEERNSAGTLTDRFNGTTFQQRYSLLYSTSGQITDGRLARYNIALGYEWGSFDTKIKLLHDDTNLSTSAGHLLYRGEILVDPPELPLRLKAYSRDLNKIAFIDSTLANSFDYLIYPSLTTELRDGTRISSGVTLTLGAKNGLGSSYGELFRHLPVLMVDYRDELTHDVKSSTPIDTRMQRLAFVSLNKRDNWFHYRSTKFSDYLDQTQSFNETQVQIGTIDQSLERRWVNMTNWIKVSADAQFTKHSAVKKDDSFEEYDVNLFGIASRSTWEARSFANYNRTQQLDRIDVSRVIPLYVAGSVGLDTDWNVRVLNREKLNSQGKADEQSISNDAMSLRFTTFKRSQFTLSPLLSAEYSTDSQFGKNLALEAGVESRSTKRFSRDYDLFGSYNVRYFRSDKRGAGNESDSFIAQDLTASVGFSPTIKTRLTASQTFTVATGKNPQASTNTTVITPGGGNNSPLSNTGTIINGYKRSLTSLSAGWLPDSRFRVALTALEDVISIDEQPISTYTTLTNTVSYKAPHYDVNLDSSLYMANVDNTSSYTLSFSGYASYKPNRNIDSFVNARLELGHNEGQDVRFIDMTQRFNYYFYKFNGVVRRLVELSEELTYQDSTTTIVNGSSVTGAKRLMLGAKYFPTARLFVGGFARYSLVEPGSLTQQLYSAYVGINYNKLQANLEYSYGNQTGGTKRVESKFAANLKKYF